MSLAVRDGASRILVIDDNPAIHEDFRKIFHTSNARSTPSAAEQGLFGHGADGIASHEFELDSASQGQEGLAMVELARQQRRPYALAFVDVRMPPGWDGVETTARIWAHDPDIQVVICTAYSDYSWNEMLARLGRSDRLVILKKPFDTIEVVQLASALTEKWRLERQSRSMMQDLECRVVERTQDLMRAGERLRASETQYRLLFDSNPHPMWVYDLETLRFATVNGAAVAHYGYTEQQFMAMTIRDIRAEEDVLRLEIAIAAQQPGKGYGVWRHRRQDGSLIDVEISSDSIVFNGRPARLVLAHDVTERNQTEIKIKRMSRVYAVLSQINALIVRVSDPAELFRSACRIAVETGGLLMALICIVDASSSKIVPVASEGVEEGLLAAVRNLLSSDESAGRTMVARAVRHKEIVVSNDSQRDPAVLLGSDYSAAGVRSLAVLPLIVAGNAVGVLALYAGELAFFRDDELKLLTELADDIAFAIDHIDKQAQLDYLAFYDVLTGLANRALFHERLDQGIVAAREQGQKLALVLLDIERFKTINDTLGRPVGNALLKEVAARLSASVVDAGRVGRLDADHFALMVRDVHTEQDVARFIEQRMADVFGPPFRIGDAELTVSPKFGIAMYPDDGIDADALFRNAEAALKKAKASGDRYLFYTQTMNARVAETLTLENQLRRAVDNDEFVLHYQPKVSLQTGRLTSAEALIRWNDPRTGLVPPDRFIPVLEETGLIHPVGRWALHKAIEDYLRWRSAGLAVVRIAVNVSPLQLRNRGFVDEVAQAIGIDPHAAAGLELEITESLLMEDVTHSIACLRAIRALGIRIAIDDFGTGFSSLSYLSKLPIDALKIDRSFVTEMTVSPEGLALVSTIIHLAHALMLKVVAEGVETEEQSRLLRLLSCDEMQGYVFSRPVPADAFEASFLVPEVGEGGGGVPVARLGIPSFNRPPASVSHALRT